MKVLIVDGYNVIRATQPYLALAEAGDLDAARAALVSDVAAYATGEWQAIVVFDAARNPSSTGLPHEVAGVHVIFSRYGSDADSVVERQAREARERGDEVLVVTSDAQTQWTVMGTGVSRMSSPGFREEMTGQGRDWREHSPAGSPSSRLEQRIPEDVRDALSRWARGE